MVQLVSTDKYETFAPRIHHTSVIVRRRFGWNADDERENSH